MTACARWVWLALAVGSPAWAAPQAEHDHGGHSDTMMQGTAPVPQDAFGVAPPPPPSDHAADAFFPPDRMALAREALIREDRITYGQVLVERVELRTSGGRTGYAWEAEASTGTDRDRFVVWSQGEGRAGDRLERAELQARWRHALDPWFDGELGLRHDLRPGPQRTYLFAGVHGLAPYWIDTEAQLFVSDKGDVHARIEVASDQRITQRLVLRPEAEIDVALQDVAELGIASPVPEWSIGARLRYELRPDFAPYVGVEWRRDPSFAKEPRRRGDGDRQAVNLLVGLRAWL